MRSDRKRIRIYSNYLDEDSSDSPDFWEDLVDNDEMSPAEAGFIRGSMEA